VRAIDRAAIARHGLPGPVLMQRAAWSAFESLRRHWPGARRIVVLCGPGNNGGDGFLLARLAREAGFGVQAYALTSASGGDAALARQAWLEAGGTLLPLEAATALPEADVFVDALYGSGLARPLEGAAAQAAGALATGGTPVLALDIPSGLSADTGQPLGIAVRAAVTVTFVAWKRGLFTGASADHCDTLELADLDIPAVARAGIVPDAERLSWPDLRARLPARPRSAHKGLFGHVLAIGGDYGMGGAIRLAGEAALRVGAGLASVATRAAHVAPLLAARPELMAHAVDGPQDLPSLLERADVIALGPGLGTRAWGHALWTTAMRSGKPSVLDADALNLLARSQRHFAIRAVLTPHPAEAARLLDSDTATIQHDRFAAVRALAARYAAVVVLKGAGTLIGSPQGDVAVCPWGNPGMASGGMGDVLTGVIAGLLAQGLTAWDAACLGVALHARAGDEAARTDGERGLLAGDLLSRMRGLLAEGDARD